MRDEEICRQGDNYGAVRKKRSENGIGSSSPQRLIAYAAPSAITMLMMSSQREADHEDPGSGRDDEGESEQLRYTTRLHGLKVLA